MARLLALVLLLAVAPSLQKQINVHVKLDLPAESTAIGLNSYITKKDPHNDVELHHRHQPHITLYLTDFLDDKLPEIKDTLERLVPSFSRCHARLTKFSSGGTYGMWNVWDDCLWNLSNETVRALSPFIVPNQPIPTWVQHLPEPLRSEKISMVRKYGSPNVFSQFRGHVTLAFDNQTPDLLNKVIQGLAPFVPPQPFDTIKLGLGTVGAHGTVLRGQDIAVYDLH